MRAGESGFKVAVRATHSCPRLHFAVPPECRRAARVCRDCRDRAGIGSACGCELGALRREGFDNANPHARWARSGLIKPSWRLSGTVVRSGRPPDFELRPQLKMAGGPHPYDWC